MAHSEVCPICHGTGKLETKNVDSTSVLPSWVRCHGCDGKGWITVSDAYICPPPVVEPWDDKQWRIHPPVTWQVICFSPAP